MVCQEVHNLIPMLMYDDVVVCKADDLVDRNFKTI